MKWLDVSTPIETGIAVWPGDHHYRFTPTLRIAQAGACNVSQIALSTHTATHVDAPWHFEDNGKRLHEIDTSVYFGVARVLECSRCTTIRAEDLGAGALPQRVLLKTSSSNWPYSDPFHEDYCALDESAARRIVAEGVRLIGIDYASIAPYADPAPVHHILLRANVLIVEGLRLAEITPGDYEFTVLPLPLIGADGAPARAFIRIP